MGKLKLFGLLASVAGFGVSLIASAIDDKKMEEAVNDAVDAKFKSLEEPSEECVSEEEEEA